MIQDLGQRCPGWGRRIAQGTSRGFVVAALCLPLALPVGWLALERDAAAKRATDMLTTAGNRAQEEISELLGRFDRIVSGLRLPEAPADTAALAARVLRLEPQLAPSVGLFIFDVRGRLIAGSHLVSGGMASVVAAPWFKAAIALERAQLTQLVGIGPALTGSPDSFAVVRRIGDGGAAAVVVSFVPVGALRRVVESDRLASHGSVRLLSNGQTVLELSQVHEPAAQGLAGRLLSTAGPLINGLGTSAPRRQVVELQPEGVRWEASLDPTALLNTDPTFSTRGGWTGGLTLALILTLGGLLVLRRAPKEIEPVAAEICVQPTGPSFDYMERAEAVVAELRERLTEASAERDRVLAAIGHDVRTPINSILGIGALLLEGDLEDSQRRWVRRIRSSCEVLLAMLNGMLEVCSAQTDGAELNTDDVNVSELVREVCDVLQPQAHDKGLELRVVVEDATLGIWRTDQTRVRQVLFNLTGNAIKYTGHGSVDVRASVASTHDAREILRIQVTDTGPGIAQEERAGIFDRFQRGRAEVSAGHEGVGLGLALCREIATLMGGGLSLESTPGVGSVFTFEFPTERAQAGARAQPFAGRSALVVGLSEGVRRRIALHLEGLGFAAETAGDGFVGLGLAERSAVMHGALDLVVIDGALTGLPAEAFLLRLRSTRQLQAARAVWVAPAGMTGTAETNSGSADAIVQHPGELRDIEQAVSLLLGSTSALQTIDPEAPEAAEGRVLVVEDNKINQALLADILMRAGFSVFTASDGEEAVKAASRGGFDAIVMDVQMPIMDGIEATRRIREVEHSESRMPILTLTAHTGTVIRRRCLEAGADIVLHKPINVSQLPIQLRAAVAAARAANVLRSTLDGESLPLHYDSIRDSLEVQPEYLEAIALELGADRTREAVRDFIGDAGVRISRLQELLSSAEWAALQRTCHDLAGVAGTLGAVSLSDALTLLKDAAGGSSPERVEHAMAEAVGVWERSRMALLKTLDRILDRRNDSGQRRAA